MALDHYNAKYKISFMGKHDGSISADVDWISASEGTVTGTGLMKMLKTMEYPIMDGSTVTRSDDGTMHFNALLKSQFGNGALECSMDIRPDGKLTGTIPILKGSELSLAGELC